MVFAFATVVTGGAVAQAQEPDAQPAQARGADRLLLQLRENLARSFPQSLRDQIVGVGLQGTDMRWCSVPADPNTCGYGLLWFATVMHPGREEPYEMRTLRPAAATRSTVRVPRIAGFVAADFAIREILPIVLRQAGFADDARSFESLASARTESELRALADAAEGTFRRLRALAAPEDREQLQAWARAKVAARLAARSTWPLRRTRMAPTSRVLELVSELVHVAAQADAAPAAERTARMLERVATVARALVRWSEPPPNVLSRHPDS